MPIHSIHINIKRELLGYLQAAKKSIYAVIAWFNDEDIFRLLCRKSMSGCEVVIILRDDFGKSDSINFSKAGLQFTKLIFSGGKIFTAHDLHNKYCIIDESIYITGSYNWTNAAALRNDGFENIDIIIDENTAQEMQVKFKKVRSESIPLVEHFKAFPTPNLALEKCEIYDTTQLDKSIVRCKLKDNQGYECFVYLPIMVNDYLSSALNSSNASLAFELNDKVYLSEDLKLTVYKNMLWLDLKESTIERNIKEHPKALVRKALGGSRR